MRFRFPHFTQLDSRDCGPTCLRMIAKYYGRDISITELRRMSHITREGVSMLGISEAAETIGLHTLCVKIPFEKLNGEAPLPCIVHWNQNHFVVVYKIAKGKIYVADPDAGLFALTQEDFERSWISSSGVNSDGDRRAVVPLEMGIVLLIEPTPKFFSINDSATSHRKMGLTYLTSYFGVFKKLILQLLLALFLGSLIQLILPFLTQSIVDVGISTDNIGFIYLVLIGQLMLTISRASVEFIRNIIFAHLSARINMSIISDFLMKLMKLPLSFFDEKMTGDILRRIEDHSRIERFLSSSSLNVIFSMFNLIVFSAILAFYNGKIFLIMFFGSAVYIMHNLLFMKKRSEFDYSRFNQLSQSETTLIQLISGMREIKISNSEIKKRWDWELVQGRLSKISIDTTKLQQWQEGGSLLINETKNIVITIISAQAVLDGTMSLGMMLSVQYIIGQVNAPLIQLIVLLREYQDAKISLERIGEIHSLNNEDSEIAADAIFPVLMSQDEHGISLMNVSFQYEGPRSFKVLNDINLFIEKGKVTAIVGTSGSGKSTLLKLLLKFYHPVEGHIRVDNVPFDRISSSDWRRKCGVVMQDGFIFADTIFANITLGDENPDIERVSEALRISNILNFINSLPSGLNTKIGGAGTGISEGQKQRILISRAIYKDPEYLFFDEATSALDASNEKVIMENLSRFYKGRTVVIIAHRLSTVKNADNIIVLDTGKIIEVGNHKALIDKKGSYFELIKDQLELGS